MFSTSILGLLFALLVMQTPVAVSALPTSGTTTITGAQLVTRRASDSNRNNNDSNRGNSYGVVPPNKAATSKFALPYQATTSSTRELATQAVWSQFDKRDNSEDQKHDSNDMSLGEILGAVIAALTLLVAIIPLFRYSLFRRWVSSISPAVKEALGTKLPNPGLTTLGDPSAIPTPIPHSAYIHNNYSNTHLVGTCSDAILCTRGDISGQDRGVQPAEESLPLRRPERVVTCPLP